MKKMKKRLMKIMALFMSLWSMTFPLVFLSVPSVIIGFMGLSGIVNLKFIRSRRS